MAAVATDSVRDLPRMDDEDVANSLDDLIKRKRVLEQNKKKYHLTEADCSLLLTNANAFTFTDNQVILAEGQEISSLYRIKFGKVKIMKGGVVVGDLPQGWFVGESILLGRNNGTSTLQMSLVANGPVVINEVNVPFVQRLLAVDGLLALKFYRNLASKLASIFYALNGNCLACFRDKAQQAALESTATASLTTSSSSSSSTTSSPSTSTTDLSIPKPADFDTTRRFSAAAVEFLHVRRKRMRLVNSAHLSYKEYALDSNGNVTRTCKIKKQRIKLVSEAFGFKKKKTIEFSQIKNVSQASPTAVTIIFGNMKARTLFFKDVQSVNEFMGLLNNIIAQSSAHNLKTTPGIPLSHPRKEGSGSFTPGRERSNSRPPSSPFFSLDNSDDSDDDEDTGSNSSLSSIANTPFTSNNPDEDRDLVRTLADKIVLKKGDVLIAEGDLYQRLYSLTQGTCDVYTNGLRVSDMPEGLVFGEATLLHLRPSPVTVIVSSEEATVLIIPAYRLFKLTESNPFLSARLHKKAAQLLEQKIMSIAQMAATKSQECSIKTASVMTTDTQM